jgi:hypothetical protein
VLAGGIAWRARAGNPVSVNIVCWHEVRTLTHMSAGKLLLFSLLCTVPCTVSAQTWRDAYKAGDYQKAADLLHPFVIQSMMQLDAGDPDAAHYLATMYAQGLGVPQDAIAACSVAQVVSIVTNFNAPRYAQQIGAFDAALKAADEFISKHCDGLSNWDRMVTGVSLGCFAFGMPEQTLMLGEEAISVGRGGIWRRDAMPERPEQLQGCFARVARVRALNIAPPPNAAPGVAARHFVELLGWGMRARPDTSAPSYFLRWQLYELAGKKVELIVSEEFLHRQTNDWPGPALTQDFDQRFSMDMIRSGQIRWRLDGAPPKRGVIMLREEKGQ